MGTEMLRRERPRCDGRSGLGRLNHVVLLARLKIAKYSY